MGGQIHLDSRKGGRRKTEDEVICMYRDRERDDKAASWGLGCPSLQRGCLTMMLCFEYVQGSSLIGCSHVVKRR